VGLTSAAVPVGIAAANAIRSGSAKNVYRPAVVARLTIRLEDFSNADGQDAQRESASVKTAASKTATALASAQALQAVRRASGVADIEADAQVSLQKRRAAAGARGATAGADAAAPFGASPDDHTIQISVIPVDVSLCLNGFKTADRVSFGIQLSDLPIVPDLIRALLVEFFFGTVGADDYGDPARWIPQLLHTAPVFRGYADEETVQADSDDLKVSVTALSLEQRLNEVKVNPLTKARQVAAGGEGLADYIRRLISMVPEFNGSLGSAIGVRYFPNVDPAKEPRIDAARLKRSLQTAQSRAQAGGQVQGGLPPGLDPGQDPGGGTPAGVGMATPNPTIEVTVWDLVTRAAQLAGMIPVYDPSIVAQEPDGSIVPLGANNILLVPPQNIKETPQGGIEIPGGASDGFEREFTVAGANVRSQVRLFVWGNNISSYRITRRYGRNRIPRVRVICHNPDGGPGARTLEAFFPKTARGTKVSAVGTGPDGARVGHPPIEEEVVRVIREVRSQRELELIAVGLFHTISRHELVCIIETNELCSYLDPTRPETHNENPDLLRLRPGTPCRVVVARGSVWDPVSDDLVVNDLSELMDRRGNPAFLRRALLENPNANAFIAAGQKSKIEDALGRIEAAYQSAKLTDWFYVRDVEYTWSADDGFKIAVTLAGFQEARNLPANLSPEDSASNDQLKKVVSKQKPDARAAAIQANKDMLLLRLAEAARGGT
jgi:hypothetical protein